MSEDKGELVFEPTKERALKIKELKDKTISAQRRENKHTWGVYWDIADSPLLPTEQKMHKGKPIVSFQESFAPVLPEKENIKDYVERILAEKRGEAIGIEIGGTGSALFRGFSDGFFQKTAGVNLTDYRDQLDPDPTPEDNARNHIVIPGDLFSGETKDNVGNFLNGQKADLIISRMAGGLNEIPREPYFLGKEADHWYQQLADGGVLLAMLPGFGAFLPAWVELIKSEYKGQLEVECTEFVPEEGIVPVLKLRKLPGAPEHLPLVGGKIGNRDVPGVK